MPVAASAAGAGEQITKGNDVDTAPRRLTSVRLAWDYRPDGSAELEWVSLGSYELDAANTDRYPGHDLLHLSVMQALGPRDVAQQLGQQLIGGDALGRGASTDQSPQQSAGCGF